MDRVSFGILPVHDITGHLGCIVFLDHQPELTVTIPDGDETVIGQVLENLANHMRENPSEIKRFHKYPMAYFLSTYQKYHGYDTPTLDEIIKTEKEGRKRAKAGKKGRRVHRTAVMPNADNVLEIKMEDSDNGKAED